MPQATEVRIGLAVTDGRMTITDCGQRPRLSGRRRRAAKGNGLENMSQRLAQIGGRLVLESEPGRGTQHPDGGANRRVIVSTLHMFM